jgi:hypothetical protein
MSVKVSVINQKKLKEMPGVMEAQTYYVEETISANIRNDFYLHQKAHLKLAVDTIVRKSVKNDLDSLETDSLITNIFAEIDGSFQEATKAFEQGLLAAGKARTITDNKELLIQAQMEFATGKNKLSELKQQLNSDFALGFAPFVIPAGTIQERQIIQSLTLGAELLGDPLASFIVKTKNRKKYWKGVYNKTVTRNGFGNSDVAITMQTLGHFTIKGVRMDAANMVAASFKTLSQGIQFISSVYGVPSPTSGGEGVTTAETSAGKSKVDVESKKKELEINSRLSKLSTIAIMEAIVSRRADLGNATTLPAAVGSIKTTFDIYKPQLTTSKE